MARTENKYRIAIVGGGPKGMYCLDSLCSAIASRACASEIVSVSVFEMSGSPGAGNIYDVSQPEFLRMNFSADKINAWKQSGDAIDTQSRPSFVNWAVDHQPIHAAPSGYPPRAVIGQYLAWCFQAIVDQAPTGVQTRVIRERVKTVRRQDERWCVETDVTRYEFDEVLITVGHGGWRPAGNISRRSLGEVVAGSNDIAIIGAVFPVNEKLSSAVIPSGHKVAVGGFSLTFIDATLALTEGRGGKFIRDQDRLIYEVSGQEPKCIMPFSRTGRPMLAKPNRARIGLPVEVEEIWEGGRKTLRDCCIATDGACRGSRILSTVIQTAEFALPVARREPIASNDESPTVADWFVNWMQLNPDDATATSLMKQSCRVANGQSKPDAAWALGESWRQLYRPIVEAVSHGGLSASDWPEFLRFSREMERIAFGPPAENLERIMALVKIGIVDLSIVSGCSSRLPSSRKPRRTDKTGSAAQNIVDIDLLVDATIAAPHHHPAKSLLGTLLRTSQLKTDAGSGAIAVDQAGTAVDVDGNTVEGLAIIGRPTEGWVLGNDTLSRQLHSEPENWARHVAAKIATVT